MYIRFGKVFHGLTILLFLFVFLYFYAALSDRIAYAVDEDGGWLKTITKGTFFYTGLIIFGLLNVILAVPGKMIENGSIASLKRLFPVGDIFREYILLWIYSFIGIINVSLSILTLFVHSINNQNEISADSFSFFFYLVPIFFLTWILALFWILFKKFQDIKENSPS
ncbi:DNA topoisomerase IV [Mongoliitalea lutea]|uniref:DNA topoisomerase IV n=1 Tax=Mongoliitalea lutea TaxID=849756 RepID=A0A8J3CWN8_9BACT|nr:DNA topoisomerase IV [Mongoliitalea lutea]GHB29266.1 hypothetical protein GCM10008106_07720 [Mongoliitalea lutea]